MEMKMNYALFVILLIASGVSCLVAADSREDVSDTKSPPLPESSDDKVNHTVDSMKKGTASNLDANDSRGQSDPKGEREEELKKPNLGGAHNNDPKDNEGSHSKSTKKSKEARSPPIREKCDSSSNHCTDDDKTMVACLRVPGNESPTLSLLIQNKGKGPLSIAISAPALVQLDRKQIELQENKDTEVKVSIRDVENGHFIVLTAGHGNCTLNFRDQFVGRKQVDHSSDSYSNIFKLTLSTGVLFLAALLILVVSVFMCAKLRRKYFAIKGPKYQKLDMELPVSHGSKLEPGKTEGWDDSWGDSWDDEEAPKTPSLPVTPSISSKGMASRKFKEGWKD